MAFISGIALMFLGGKVFTRSEGSKDDPNWGSILGIVLFLAGIAAFTKGCNGVIN